MKRDYVFEIGGAMTRYKYIVLTIGLFILISAFPAILAGTHNRFAANMGLTIVCIAALMHSRITIMRLQDIGVSSWHWLWTEFPAIFGVVFGIVMAFRNGSPTAVPAYCLSWTTLCVVIMMIAPSEGQ